MPPNNPSFEISQPKVKIVQSTPKLKTNLPDYVQTQVDNMIQETREKKEKELKIESIFQALENKYNGFDRTKFDIKDTMF
jgi:hypothetical protein